MNAIASQLQRLLSALDQVAAESEEIFDSDCRQEMGEAVMEAFVRANGVEVIPKKFGILNDDACVVVHEAIACFAMESLKLLGSQSFKDRLESLQDTSVQSDDGNDYEEYFGRTPSEFYDEDGNVLRLQ